ncbi:hypothetical protein PDIDSM_1601 [Penicillium digitatum]|nr:hypothetical protein PDIDSM_1601 [Penicillium digitatum]
MSAAKTSKGTLDSQDAILFSGAFDESLSWGMDQESERARLACKMAENEWEGRIDGVLRMEAGFEIILCDFERDLTPVRITQAKQSSETQSGHPGNRNHGDRDDPRKEGDGKYHSGHSPRNEEDVRKGHGRGGPGSNPNLSRWMRAITAHYNGIGGNRVSLNYNHFVTAFSHNIELFQDNSTLPRLTSVSPQAITDMVVTRYSKELSYFVSGSIDSIEHLYAEIERVLSPFVDYSERDDVAEIERCATQFLSSSSLEDGDVAAQAVHGVARRICSSLIEARKEKGLDSAVQIIQNLVLYLDWATWKECRGCAANEICVVPIWPMGSIPDYNNPQCKDASNPYDESEESYWGGMHS